MDTPDRALTDDELLAAFNSPKADLSQLTSEEQNRLITLTEHLGKVPVGERGGLSAEGPFGRFVEGAARNLNPIAAMQFLAQVATHPTEAGKAIVDPSVAQLGEAAQAYRSGRPAAALGHVAGATPIVGPAVMSALGQMQQGNTAGGLGELTGLAAPFVAGPLARGGMRSLQAVRNAVPVPAPVDALLNEAGTSIGESAAARLAKFAGPQTGLNKQRLTNAFERVAPTLLRDPDLGAFSQMGFAHKIQSRLDQASEALDTAADARLASKQVKTGPLLQAINGQIKQLTAEPVEASAIGPRVQQTETGTSFTPGGGTPQSIDRGALSAGQPYGRPVVPTPNTGMVKTLQTIRDEIAALGPTAPYEAIRRIRQAWDNVARVKYSPAVSPDYLAKQGEATAASQGTAAMREALAQTDPASAEAYRQFHLYKTANDAVQAAVEAERTRPNRGRGIMARTAGAMIGAREGGAVGAGIGAVVAGIADGAAQMAPSFQVVIARRLAAVADLLRRGDVAGADQVIQSTVQRFPAAKTTLKITGKLTPVMGQVAAPGLAAVRADQQP